MNIYFSCVQESEDGDDSGVPSTGELAMPRPLMHVTTLEYYTSM